MPNTVIPLQKSISHSSDVRDFTGCSFGISLYVLLYLAARKQLRG
jgi:hypothetical protein